MTCMCHMHQTPIQITETRQVQKAEKIVWHLNKPAGYESISAM